MSVPKAITNELGDKPSSFEKIVVLLKSPGVIVVSNFKEQCLRQEELPA